MPPTRTRVVVPMTFVQASALLARCCQAAHFAVLVHRIHDPVDAWVAANSFVHWINENDFEVLICAVLVDPVRVEHTQVGAAAADTFLGGGAERALVLQLVHTLVGGLAFGNVN